MPTPPVENCEFLFRQIKPGTGTPHYFDPTREHVVHPSAFYPSPSDQDGLSLIRARYRQEKWAAFRPEKPEIRFILAKLTVATLRAMALETSFGELTFKINPDSLDREKNEPWAHCTLEEFNTDASKKGTQSRIKIRELAEKISTQIGPNSVIASFSSAPSEGDEYRPADSLSDTTNMASQIIQQSGPSNDPELPET